MKLGLFTCGYQRLSLEQAFFDAKRFGYDYVELWGGFPHAYVPDLKANGTEKIKQLIEKYEMPVHVFTPEHNGYPFNYMMGDEAQWERSMSYLEDAIEVTAEIGAPYMLFSVGHAGHELSVIDVWARLKRSVERLVKKAEEMNVILIMEPLTVYESNVVNDINSLEYALSLLSSKYLIGMCDLAVPFTNGEPAAMYVRRLKERFGYLHIIDNDGVSDSHILPGDGNLPLREVLAGIRQEGYDGLATIELVTGYLKEPSAYARIAVERVRAMMNE